MKRFFSALCLLLLIFVFISCDNFSLIGKHSAKGTVYIQIPDSHAGRSVTLQTQEDVKDYNIFIYNNKTDSLVYEKEFSPWELYSGIAIELNHGDYLINVVAYDSNGELFSGTNSEPVHVTSDNTPENPAVVTINMKYVLVIYDNGPGASSRCRHFETLEEDTVPSRLKPDPSFLPRKFFIRGREIISWTDMDTSENYDVGEEILLDGKTLPLHLTANWSEPTGPTGGTVTYTLYSNQKEGDEGRSIKTAEKGSTVFLSRPWDGEYTCETSSYMWCDSSYYNYYVFCGWSTKQVPVLTSENYNEYKEVLKNAKVVNWGEGYYLTEDTSFYAVWMATDIYDEKTLPVRCTLGKDEDNEAANVRLYYLKDLFTTEEVDDWLVYKFTLPDIPTLFPQWDTAPALAIKDEYWVINNDYENASGNFAGHVTDIRTTYEDITLKAGIKVPLIEYYDGGTYYNSGEYNAAVITDFDTDFEEAIYAMTWPLPSSYSIKLWQPIDQNYAETPFASSVYYAGHSDYWRFDRWFYMDSDENVLVDQDGWFSTYGISTDSFPLQLSARWRAPEHTGATSIRTKDDLMNISSNGIYSLENNLRLESYDLLSPLVEEFNGTFYGNGMTIAIIGSAVPLFDTIGTDGTITELNISGNLDDYSSYKSLQSMLCHENKGEVSWCMYRSYDSIPQVDCIFGGYTSGNASNYQNLSVQQWDNDKGWVNWDVSAVLTKEITTTPQGGGQQVVSYPDTGYDASDFANTKYYQCSDIQWNYPLAEGKALGITVTGNVTGDVTCTGTEFLKLKNIQQNGGAVSAEVWKYESDTDFSGTYIAAYPIYAITQYGIKTETPFLFTGEGLNHYNSIPTGTVENPDGYRMNSTMLLNAPASETAINEALDGLVRLSSADDVLDLMNNSSDDKYTKRYLVENDITVTELPKSLFEKKFNGYFDGQGHTITVTTGNAPLFKDIGESGEVSNLTLNGDFSTYTEPYRDFGVLCSNNYGKLHHCSFEGTAPSSTSESVGTTGVFGYQAPGSTSENNSITSGTVPSDALLYSTMYQITMIPVTGATVSSSIGSGAFKDAGTTSVTVGNFLIAEAEVTYAQWCDVYAWATNNGYTFSSESLVGRPGDNGTDGAELTTGTATEPVTNISYSDILVWCNAASEKQGLVPVYYDSTNSSKVLKNATTSFSLAATSNPTADGYRLPEQKEWEYAARGGNPDDTTAWNYTYAGTTDPQGYAVQYSLTDANGKSYSQMAYVKTLKPNTAGLYDMSGNAGEYFYPMGSGSSCYHSSSRNSLKNSLSVDYVTQTTTRGVYDGFRVVRNNAN